MQRRFLDGLSKAEKHEEKNVSSKGGRSLRQRVRWPLVVLLLVSIIVGWVEPLWAAMPVKTLTDRLSLTSLARPGVYLVLFQNPRELRPTGGFLGSFAEIELGWGLTIKKVTIETNIYTRDKQFTSQLAVETPEPLEAFIGGEPWRMRDSNWALDFPEAAETVAWFYEQEGGRPVDGVIAIDTRLLERLLRLTGPIGLPNYDRTVTAETVVDQLQAAVEIEYWLDPSHLVENQPKSILADLVPEVLERITRVPTWHLADALVSATQEKEILFALRRADVRELFKSANWDGHVPETHGDYLYINEANLTSVNALAKEEGAKSSWSVKRTASLRTSTPTQGYLNHQLTYTRSHLGERVWPDGPNHSYLRIAVPPGSRLTKALKNGEDILGETRLSSEAGKTVFGLWSRLNPGDSDIIQLEYQSPEAASETLYLQRQPGMPAYPVELWENQELTWSGNLTQDMEL